MPTYYFEISSTDEAGNTVTDNNGGIYYSLNMGKKSQLVYTSTQSLSPPDGSAVGAESTISVTESRIILDLNLTINYEGIAEEDLTFYLKGPDGTQVMLADRRGVRLEENILNTTFDDEAESPVSIGFPPFGGSCQPEDPLRIFKGKNTQGIWTLKIVDNYRQGTGNLNFWTLKITAFREECDGSIGTVDFLDEYYGCKSNTTILLSDSDFTGAGSISVNAKSSTENNPEIITLYENPSNSGKFKGSILLTDGSVSNGDGKLSVKSGDLLTASYMDGGILRTGNAIVDCQPPQILDFKIENLAFDIVSVSWKTNKPSNSKIIYGNTIPPLLSIQDLEHYSNYHKFTLEGLTPCIIYYLSISSADLMGNKLEDNNSGNYFTFKTLGVNYLLGPDDVESGQGVWSVSQGSGSFWHIDRCRSYSGNYSWKAGALDYPTCSSGYLTGSETYLIIPVLDFGSEGGIHIRYREYMETNVSDPFAGDYGRPMIRNPGGSWEPWTYFYAGKASPWKLKDYIFIDYLGNYYTGSKQVSLVFKSDFTADSPTLEGWFVDDISIYKDYPCQPEIIVSEKAFSDICSGTGSGGGNGKIDPGEDITLQITLKNKGSIKAKNVYANLSTNNPNISILQNIAYFNDIEGFGSQTSISPHFIFRVEESTPCNTPIYFNLNVISDEGFWNIAIYLTVASPCNICDSSLKVEVVPDSKILCLGEEIQLNANVAGVLGNVYYQWTMDGQDIPGSTNKTFSISYNTPQTHNFNCKVRDNISSNIKDLYDSTITWHSCSPELSYDSSYYPVSSLVEVCGDSDGVVEPGEKWQANIKIKNTGGADATNVYVYLSISPSSPVNAQIFGSPIYFSKISKNSSSIGSFVFLVSQNAICVNSLIFDITNIQSDQGTFEGKSSAFLIQVGASGSQTINQPLYSTIYASNSYQTYSFEQPLTLPSVDSATLSFTLNYNSNITMSSNIPSSIDAWVDQANPTYNGGIDQVMHIQRRNNQARRSLVQFDFSAIPSGSTVNSATLYLYTTSVPSASQQLDVHRNQSSWTETGVNWNNKPTIGTIDSSTAGGTSTGWKSWNVLSLVQGWINGTYANYGVQIKCNNEGGNTTYNYQFATRENSDSTIRPYLNVNYTINTGGNITQNVKVELVDPMGKSTIIKNYGQPYQSSYNITPYYIGPGNYKIKLSENKGGIALLSSANISINLSSQSECEVSACSSYVIPPPVGNGKNNTIPMKLSKLDGNPANLFVTWDSSSCSSDHAVVLYGNIGNWTNYMGAPEVGCNLGSNGTQGANFTTSATNVWFNLIWVNSQGAGGHPGVNSQGQKRNLNAAGLCGITSDDHSDSTCD